MLSASHNPMPDNGIKLFAAGGHKLADEVEERIEAARRRRAGDWRRPTGAGIGRVHDLLDGAEHYVQAPGGSRRRTASTGIKVVVDCANGAASEVAPAAYRAAGAEVIAINAEPDGLNINDGCGSTHLDVAAAAVVEHGADLGHRPRRRRRPLPGGHRRRRGGRRRPDHGDPGAGDAGGRHADRGHAGRHRDEQPRPAAGDARGRASG